MLDKTQLRQARDIMVYSFRQMKFSVAGHANFTFNHCTDKLAFYSIYPTHKTSFLIFLVPDWCLINIWPKTKQFLWLLHL